MKDEQVNPNYQTMLTVKRHDEAGFALVAALIILVLLGVISVTVLAFSTSETRVATSEIKRTEAFYAAEAKLEEMTNRFNNLFHSSAEPPQDELDIIAHTNSATLTSEIVNKGYSFAGSDLTIDQDKVDALTAIFGTNKPFISIPDGPFYRMSATVTPYFGVATATDTYSGTSVRLRRNFNSYLLPVFQFSLFSDGDIELDPGQPMYISGRVHANKNVYALRNLLFTGNITAAGELVRDVNRGGSSNSKPDDIGVSMMVKSPSSTCTNQICRVPFYNGAARSESVIGGPRFLSATNESQRGFHPGSWPGSPNLPWDTDSIIAPDRAGSDVMYGTIPITPGTPGHFNKQVLTTSSDGLGIEPLTLPLGLDNVKAVELIKRSLPNVDTTLISDARYDNKAQIRILIDDQGLGTNEAGITGTVDTVGGGVNLTNFNPIPLGSGNCNALRIFDNSGGCTYNDYGPPTQKDPGPANGNVAETVRGVRNYVVSSTNHGANVSSGVPTSPNGAIIPPGSGIQGRIKIEVVPPCAADPCPAAVDVTKEILSMGMTIGEPNAIVRLQRPLWAAFMQDSFDRASAPQSDMSPTLFNLQNGSNGAQEVDGEIKPLDPTVAADIDPLGYIKRDLNNLVETAGGDSPTTAPKREATPDVFLLPPYPSTLPNLNVIVPINVYNVREGWINTSQNEYNVYRRGVTSVIDINMRNLARWLDGKFDGNLLGGTNAQSTNIGSDKGYVIYVSDRRGDKVRTETTNSALVAQGKPALVTTTNGNVDNEDIYFTPVPVGTAYAPNGGPPDVGEEVITDSVFVYPANTLRKDILELPDNFIQPDPLWVGVPNPLPGARFSRAIDVMSWDNSQAPVYFRRAVRLSNGEDLTTTCSASPDPAPYPPDATIITWTCNPLKLNEKKGITIASENMVYIAGDYNTKGVGIFTTGGSNLNTGKASDYLGPQVPSSIICDAFFPLSRTWFDANAAMYPEGNLGGRTFHFPVYRQADAGNMYPVDSKHPTPDSQETAVRTAIMFGTTLSALDNPGGPARNPSGIKSSGGMHSAPRFLELWDGDSTRHWSFTGSMVTLFNSTQAFAPWESGVAYKPPIRNWSYDSTFSKPDRLPPGTPFFQYVQSSGFEQIIDR